jgi:hypothetical protein
MRTGIRDEDKMKKRRKLVKVDRKKTIYRRSKIVITIMAFALGVIFAWLKLKGVEFTPIVRAIPASLVLNLSLALYYWCWIFGARTDTYYQEQVYEYAPNEGRFPASGYLIAVLLTAFFGFMCWLKTFEQFAACLTAFFVVNILGWIYMVRWMLPTPVRRSREAYRTTSRFSQLASLEIVRHHICGSWQWVRFAAGGLMIAWIDLLVYTRRLDFIAKVLPGVSAELVFSFSFLAFILVIEGWIWYKRLWVLIALDVIEDLDTAYKLEPSSKAPNAFKSTLWPGKLTDPH